MIKIKNVLWTTDGSDESNKALKLAKLISKNFNSKINGLYVIKDINKKVYKLLNINLKVEEIIENEKIRINSYFQKIKNRLKKDDIKFDYSIAFGKIDNEILKFAKCNKIDLIIMGKRGFGLMDTNLTGSITNKVVQSSKIPVLVSTPNINKRISRISKILVPINLNEDIKTSLEYSVFLAKKFRSSITVVYVEEYFTYPVYMPIPILDDLRNYFNKRLNKLIHNYKKQGIKINTKVIESVNTYLGIHRLCESLKPDLIIMNTHGRKGLKKYFVGSVAEKIISDMPCPVITIRP
jgi:nucleotide-binding universal stress UspA family protein